MSSLFLPADLSHYDALCFANQDGRPLPSQEQLTGVAGAIMTELLDTVIDTALEDHLTVIAEGMLGAFQSIVLRLRREHDRAGDEIKRLTRAFDGSEIADVELQEATSKASGVEAAQTAIEIMRDAAADTYTAATGDVWTPWRGNAKTSGATAALIDAKAALKAKRTKERGRDNLGDSVVVFRGSRDANTDEDRKRIFSALDWAFETWPNLALAVTGADGADQLALKWASFKGVKVAVDKPEFDKFGKAAPFRANDELLLLEPVCVLTMPQTINHARRQNTQPSGPILNMGQKAAQAGVRHIEIKEKAASAA